MTSFKKFWAIVFCLLSLAISGFCVYKIIESRDFEPSLKLHITDNAVINGIIETVIKFDENLQGLLVVGTGLTALLFYVFFSDTMHEFFSTIPLGSIRKFDYFGKSGKWKAVTSLSPSLIIGLYTAIHLVFYKLLPAKLDFCIKWILPIAVILTIIVSVALVISVIIDGGLWGIIVRVPLLFTINLCFSAIFGPIIALSGTAIIFIGIPAIILAVVAVLSPKYVIIHRD